MNRSQKTVNILLKIGIISLLSLSPVFAQEDTGITPQETTFIFNSFLLLVSGTLVMWMAAGFCMLEAGLVRSKNVSVQCTKNVAAYSLATITFALIGYHLMYPSGNWTITGLLGAFQITSLPPVGDVPNVSEASYTVGSDFFYQVVFCATTASIVSGAVAERLKFSAFAVFTVILTSLIYPIAGSWQWGGGFLKEIGFSDFAGSTLVHSVGGWAALTGVLMIGSRHGRFDKDGKSVPMRGSNLTLAALGTLILWMGWLGFNGGSQLALGTLSNVSDVSRILANTNIAAAAGSVGCMIVSRLRYGKIDLTMVLNGALGGLVAITAEPLYPSLMLSVVIGLVASVIVFFAVEFLEKCKIDDVVGAIPVHLVCGLFGTLIVPISNPNTSFGTQLIGMGVIAVFVVITSAIAWFITGKITGLRPDVNDEMLGLDKAELGLEAYPEFVNR